MKVILIDDEPLARAHLRRLLLAYEAEVLAEGKTGVDALNMTEELRPDVVFLDIEMPDLTGMQAAAALSMMSPAPIIVFVTGFSEHAPKAFEHAAFDYLLKPVTPERLALTISRARRLLAGSVPENASGPDQDAEAPSVPPEVLTLLTRLPIRTDYAIKLLRVEEILCAVAREKKVYVRTSGAEHKTYYTLTQLEKLLPSANFMRVHASVIVRLDAIDELSFLGNHTYSVKMHGGPALPVGRSQFAELQRRLGLHA